MKGDFKCLDCGKYIDIEEHELYELYEENEDTKFIDCPYCCVQQAIKVTLTFRFESIDIDD